MPILDLACLCSGPCSQGPCSSSRTRPGRARGAALHPGQATRACAQADRPRLRDRLLVGLGLGADDYVTKPFSPRELVARVHAILRRIERVQAPPGAPVRVGDVELDPTARRARRGGDPVHLTPTEFDLLHFLAVRPGVVFTREQLLAEVWGWPNGSGTRTVASHVQALRRKLGAGVVLTVHGVGYAAPEGAR